MDLSLNLGRPKIMHIDLNSCFATIEQQANPLSRGRPLVVAAYNSPSGCVIAPSIEAKKLGIKVGFSVRQARLIYPRIIVRLPDPAKYRDVHLKFKKIFCQYSPQVFPKSIDEAVIDFSGTSFFKRDLKEVGLEIKKRIRQEIGEWISCNIGIATNRFLAKLAASLNKPDGLELIDAKNLKTIYQKIELTDLCGINQQLQRRLNYKGIDNPLDFLNASLFFLLKQVFKSIDGYYWYLRLRGWEVDQVEFLRKSFGQSYALGKKTKNTQELAKILMKLCEKMGRRLRRANFIASGIHVAVLSTDNSFWHKGKIFAAELYSTNEIYQKVKLIFNLRPPKKVAKLAVSCFKLKPAQPAQPSLFKDRFLKMRNLSSALDKINDCYGEYMIAPALMMGMENKVLDRIAFGGTSELENIYQDNKDSLAN